MQSENALMMCFFIATLGVMLILSSIIFMIYCFIYEIKNKKKLYKESKISAIIAIVLGLVMVGGAIVFLNK